MTLRVLHVNNLNAPVGGTETYLHTLLGALTNAGVEVGLMHGLRTESDWVGDPWPTFFVPELETRGLLPAPLRLREFKAAVERFAPDVIELHNILDRAVLDACCELRPTIQFAHVQATFSCPGGAKYLKTRREACHRSVSPFCIVAPTVQHCGSRRPWVHLAAYARVVDYQRGAARLSRVVVGSHYMRDEMLLNGVARDRVVVAPLPSTFQRRARAPAPAAPPEPIVLFVGRLFQNKGADMLLDAARRMATACHVVIAGDGPERPTLEAKAASLRSRHRVTFTGWTKPEDIDEWYARSSVVAVTSLWPEPYGLIGVEAMTHSKPIVAFDVGGVRTWLRDGVNGLLLPAKDVVGFAAALDRLLTDPALAKRMGDAGAELVAGELSLERHVATMMDVYRDAVASRGGP